MTVLVCCDYSASYHTEFPQEWLDNEDFLKQCVPRLGRLIDVGLSGDGRLPEELLQRCLDLNDYVQAVLEGRPVDVVREPLFGSKVLAWGAAG